MNSSTPTSDRFGGLPHDVLAGLTRGGFATWMDFGERDGKATTAQGALVVNAPIQTVYETTTDFANFHKFVSLSKPSTVVQLGPNRQRVTFRERIGLAILSVGIDLTLELRLEAPNRVICERYVDGSFSSAFFEMDFVDLGDETTLMIVTFFADMRSLGWLPRVFLKRLPELEMAIGGNVPILPATAFAEAAEKRAGRTALTGPPPLALHSSMTAPGMPEALRKGLLTVGRKDASGEILDVASASYIPIKPEALWPTILDPAVRQNFVSIVDRGKILQKTADRVKFTYSYVVRIGLLRKRYTTTVDAAYVAPTGEQMGTLVADRADTDKRPAQYADHLLPEGEGTLLCHTYWADLKSDWLTKRFLTAHTEMEHLIATYPPFILVRAVRGHYA